MEKEINIQIPEGYEIDYENSTFKCIKFKEKKEIRTWEDYKKEKKCCDVKINCFPFEFDDKFLKHMEAELKIKLLMPYYGGEITDEEWGNEGINKYIVYKGSGRICTDVAWCNYSFFSFHTKQQRGDFLKYNEQLIKDYFMIND